MEQLLNKLERFRVSLTFNLDFLIIEKIEDFIKKIVQCSHNTIMTQAQLQSRALRLLFSLSLPACENYLNFDKVLLRVGQLGNQQDSQLLISETN